MMLDLKEQMSEYEKLIDALKKSYKQLEEALFGVMNQQGVTKIGASTGSASIRDKVVPHVLEWEAFYEAIVTRNAPYLLERRPSAKACAEEHAINPLPGVDFVTLKQMVISKPR